MHYQETNYAKFLRDNEWEIIKDWLENTLQSPSMRMCIYVMAMMGLRVGEATTLKYSNFASGFKTLTFYPLKKRIPKKMTRKVPKQLTEKLLKYHRKYKHLYRNGYLFFPYGNTTALGDHIQAKSVMAKFSQMRKSTGLTEIYYCRKVSTQPSNRCQMYRVSPHTLRHYFAWRVYVSSGKDIVVVKQLLGHEKIETTIRYIQSLEASMMEQVIIDCAVT